MKKLSLVLMSCCVIVGASAQTAPVFGAKAGINIASTNNMGDRSSSRIGLNAGFLSHIHLSPAISLQPEIMYSSQGAKYTISDGEHALMLDYINIPVLLQYNFNNGFRLQTGPQVGFLVNVKDKLVDNDANTGNFTSDDFKSTDLSWSFGLGFLSSSGLGIDARYNLGVSNINDNPPPNDAVVKNSVFQIGAFYLFNHQHKRQSR